MVGVHDFSDDGQAGLPLGLQQQLNTVRLQSLEVIGGGAGLERAAPEHGGSGGLDAFGHGDDLILALHGAGTGDDGEIPVSHLDLVRPDLNDRVQRMELPVCALERLRHAFDPLYNIQPADQVLVQLAGVADHTDDRGKIASGDVGAQVLGLDPLDQLPDPLFLGILFDNDDHITIPFFPLQICRNEKGPAVKCHSPQALWIQSSRLYSRGEPIICSKKHFYLFRPKAEKVKVAIKERCKPLHVDMAPFLKISVRWSYVSTGVPNCQFEICGITLKYKGKMLIKPAKHIKSFFALHF